MARALDVSERTVFRTKRRYAEEGLDEVLRHHNQVNRPRKVDERVEAHLIALACSPVPDGHDHWTMRALAGKLDFTHFKRHKRGNLQYDGTEWRGVSVHRSWRSIVKNPPTPTTSGYAQR